VNRGAEFEVRLPLRQADTRQPAPSRHGEHEPLLQGVSILLVDDDATDLEMTRTSLEQFGATVRTASSAREARERFRRERPDVIVSDLVMPDEDGLQLIRAIRAMDERLGRLTPAAALTAMTRADDRREALSAGFQTHVAKPADPLELACTIEHLARLGRPDKVH
jgi:CheY-like chemotaxis protein